MNEKNDKLVLGEGVANIDDTNLQGTSKNDLIFAERGDDTLIGGEGLDILEGGEDFDTYIAGNGDTILDSNHKGKVYLAGHLLTGGSDEDGDGVYTKGTLNYKMESIIKIDTFNFQKYGYLLGKVATISNDAIEDEKLGPVYEIKITPIQKSLLVEGKQKSLEPGMSVTAEVKVGKRRIIEFFIYPLIKYMDEGMSVR